MEVIGLGHLPVRISPTKIFAYKNEYSMYCQVDMYTFVVRKPCEWHLGAKTCRILYMSCVLYHRVHCLVIHLSLTGV